MSRCFPFPPPGYERKQSLEDLILLKEAKRKEKKDKDRKRDKDKKEKDGSEKQRDKKDRKGKRKNKKEKHGVKRKDKDDRGKDKEISSVSGKLEGRSGEKVHPEVHNKYSSVEDEGKCSTFSQGQNGKKPLQGILPSQATEEGRLVQELNRRIRDDESIGSQFPQRVADVGRRDQEAAARTALWNPSQVLEEEKHNDGNKSFQGKKIESQGRNGEFIGKASVQNLTQVAKGSNEGIPRPLEELDDSRLEDNEKYKDKKEEKKRQGDKRKDRDKKNRVKDKHKKKENKEEKNKKIKEKANVNIENGKSETEKHENTGRNDLVGAACNSSANVLKDVIGVALNEGYIRKRKDMDTNGFLHESEEIRPNKVLALHQSTENGRKLEASSKSSSDVHAFPNNIWLDHHCRLNNGIIEATKPSPSKANPSGINMFSDQIVVPPKMRHPDFSRENEALRKPKKEKEHSTEASKRPPHPDSKYLSQILTVPTMGDWFEDNDQEWLFSKKGPPNKPESIPVGVTEELQVWSEAVHIESANIWALPYVIPY